MELKKIFCFGTSILIIISSLFSLSGANAAVCNTYQSDLISEIEYAWKLIQSGEGADEENFDEELEGSPLEVPELIQVISEFRKSTRDKSLRGHLYRLSTHITQRDNFLKRSTKTIDDWIEDLESRGIYPMDQNSPAASELSEMERYQQFEINDYDEKIERRLVMIRNLMSKNRC